MRRPVGPASVFYKGPSFFAQTTGSSAKRTTSNMGNPFACNSDTRESVSVGQSWCFSNYYTASTSTHGSTTLTSTDSTVSSHPMTRE